MKALDEKNWAIKLHSSGDIVTGRPVASDIAGKIKQGRKVGLHVKA
jgi:hypothetical protein